MNRKKSKKADLEWRKSTFFQLGIVISLSLVLMAFEFVKNNGNTNSLTIGTVVTSTDIDVIIPTKIEVEIPLPKQSNTSVFETVDDKVLVNNIFVSIEVDPDEEFPDYVPVEDDPEPVSTSNELFVAVEEMPEFPGGQQKLSEFLRDNIVYPKLAIDIGLSGKVTINFVVEPDGSLSNIRVARSTSPVLDNEAIRVVKMMPKWNPGKQRQKAVKVSYNLPIEFNLR